VKVLQVDAFGENLVKRYNALFEECPSAFIQQSAYWCRVIADLGPDRPILLMCNDGEDVAGLPLYLYEHELGNILTSVPQPGPLGGIFYKKGISEERKGAIYRHLMGYATEIARAHGCIALTIITNPFTPDVGLYERYLEPSFVFENFTQHILLDSVFKDDVLVLHNSKARNNLNRNINHCREAGYTTCVCRTESQLQAWYAIHKRRFSELSIEPRSYHLFSNIFRELVPKNKAQLVLTMSGDKVIAGGFHIKHKDVVDAYMLSMDSSYTKPSPVYLCVKAALDWARSTGAKIYNWQSSQNRQSGVYLFKKQWGSLDRAYYFVTKLFCEPKLLQSIGLERLKSQYCNHYVVPFGVFEHGFEMKYFKKGA